MRACPLSIICLNTSFAVVELIFPLACSVTSSAKSVGCDRECADLDRALVQLAHHFAHDPVARGFRIGARARPRPHNIAAMSREPVSSAGVVGGQPVLRHEALLFRVRQLGQRAAHALDQLLRSPAARAGPAPGNNDSRAPLPCCASRQRGAWRRSHRSVSCVTRPPLSRTFDLALELELDGLLDLLERVQVLDLGLHAQSSSSGFAHGCRFTSQRRLPSSMLPSQMPR